MRAQTNTARSRRLATASAALALFLIGTTPTAKASLIIAAGSTTVNAGGSGFVDITLTNNASTAVTGIDTFSVEFSTGNSFVTFTNATMATTTPYIFAGNSLDVTLSIPFYSSSPEPNVLDSAAGTAATIDGNTTKGLARIFFTVASNATSGPASITLSTDGTTALSDVNGGIIAASESNGTITINAATTPEPSMFVPLVVLLAGMVLRSRRIRPASL